MEQEDQVSQALQGLLVQQETRDPEGAKAPRGLSSLGHQGQRANQDSQVVLDPQVSQVSQGWIVKTLCKATVERQAFLEEMAP